VHSGCNLGDNEYMTKASLVNDRTRKRFFNPHLPSIMDKNDRIIIVGAGVFGLSTALRLKEEGYKAVTVLDRSMPPVSDGSSNDISRIIRFDYGDPIYADIAKEAYDLWKTDDYSDAFYPAPCFWVCQEGTPEEPVQSRAQGYSEKTKRVLTEIGQEWTAVKTVAEAKQRFPKLTGELATPGFDGFYNTAAGWADAGKAITRLAARCVHAGVSFITGPNGQVVDFEMTNDGSITSVKTAGGATTSGDRFIVATGAWTASLVPAWNSMLAAGQIVGYMKLTPEEVADLRDIPIYFNFSTGFFCFPPHEGTGYLKVACHGFGYTNSNESNISSPPSKPPASRANFIPEDGLTRLTSGLKSIFPQFSNRGFERVGICWYNDTPTGDFILDYHPEHKNLFIATGGSGQ
jgi:sarcosine oxidase/L-pipecolate oxidase